jgi:N6-adenosine-specific RNA methylase IME4/ParB-like chromosome segregation protein Spo0J
MHNLDEAAAGVQKTGSDGMDMLPSKYQLFDPLPDDDYQRLKDDIAERGILVPVELDETGAILDGHHRIRIAKELGIKDYPTLVRVGLTEEQKRCHVRALNILRRHLTKEQRDAHIKAMRQEGMSTRAIADVLGVNASTVSRNTGVAFATPEKVTGKDGKQYPARKPRQQAVIARSEAEVSRAIDAIGRAETIPEKLTDVKQLEREVNRQHAQNKPQDVPLPTDKYRVIYADPPWKYGNTMPEYFYEQADHYPLMTVEELCAMPVKEIAEDNAVLFMWVTSPILEESFQVINAWGFKYKASFVWDKIKHNMGHYNSVRHEFLLVCVRGSCQPDVKKLFDSVVSEERTEHSKKPETFRNIIDTIYTHGKKLELFARTTAEGWEVFGNEYG